MKYLILLVLFSHFTAYNQSTGNFIYPNQKGKVISQIFKNNNIEYALLVPFFKDFDGFEESDVCEINNLHELVNCKKLSDSTFYWNSKFTNSCDCYIFSGIKSSDIYKLDSFIIEKRDLEFNLLQRYVSYIPFDGAGPLPLVSFDSSHHLFLQCDFKNDLIEYIIPAEIDLLKVQVKTHINNYGYITNLINLDNHENYLGYYPLGITKTDSTFANPKELPDSILIRRGNILESNDSGYIAFGSAKVKNDASELGIIKFNKKLEFIKIDTFGEGFSSFEVPAVAYSISKHKNDYYISAFINLQLNVYLDTSINYLYIGRFDKDINRIWLKKVGGDRHYVVWGVEASDNGGCCIYGMCRSKETKYKSVPFIMCVDENGSITSIEEKEHPYLDFTLLGNPGGNELKFNLGGQSESVSYQIADLSGHVITKGIGKSGMNIISALDWPSGVYILTFYNRDKILHSEKWIKTAK